MSLKTEQRLDSETFTEVEPRIYSTGSFLIPMCITLKNKKRYIWVVDEFDDDTFDKNGVICEPKICANSIEALL
jgi:hypothetical protein